MFRNTTIKKKLLFVILFMSAMLLAVGAFGLKGMTVIKQNFRGVYHDRLIPTGQLAHINEMMQTNVRQLQLASMHDPRLPESKLHSHPLSLHTEIIEKNIGEISALWQQYMTTYLTPEEKKLADEYVKERMTFVNDGLKPAMALLKAGKFAEANVHIVTVVGPAYQKAKDIAEKLLQLQLDITKEEYEKSEVEYTLELTVSIVTIVVGIAFSLMMGVFLLRSIGASLAMANRIANNIASGDLTGKVEIHTNDEIGQLLESMRAMQNSLTHIVNQVRSGADTIATASSQIAAGNMDLSSRTEEQASSLEETASSMEELTSTVRQNADNARHANQLAVTASDVAVKGGAVVSQVVTTMGEINESAKKMTDIIGAIDGIAFQTNILALNAAVEAARAGEQGRGFAVVATEVRNLAQRSAAAAREIKTLIDDSVQRISEGGRLAGEAGVTMDDVVSSIKRVTDIMSEITAASREQSDGIEQVNQAVAQMDQVTQQNAALVEESAAAAESMQDQAAHLVQVVGVFRTGTETASLTAPVARTATTRPVTRLPAKPTSAVAVSTANSTAQTSSRQALPATSKNEDWEEF